jgi:hypothetical protein
MGQAFSRFRNAQKHNKHNQAGRPGAAARHVRIPPFARMGGWLSLHSRRILIAAKIVFKLK